FYSITKNEPANAPLEEKSLAQYSLLKHVKKTRFNPYNELMRILEPVSYTHLKKNGTSGVAVKCVDIGGTPVAKAASWTATDAEARKRGEQT
ncbi:hypothetical protein, partial [Campylobacter jejuni]|uniref:hypothetical protein n=1 Tax=Campylobacter jejuni TaxID=197 RepID=UPI00196A8089